MIKLIVFISLSFFASLGLFTSPAAADSQPAVNIQREVVVSTCVEPIVTPNPANFGTVHHFDNDGNGHSITTYTLHYRQLVKKTVIVSGLLGQVSQIPVSEEQNLTQDFERTTSGSEYKTWDDQDNAASSWVAEDIARFIAEQAPIMCNQSTMCK